MMTLTIVSCLSNPLGLSCRRKLFESFRRHVVEDVGVPLVVVECLYGTEIPQNWQHPLYHHMVVHSSSVMWHKENLLNIGIRHILDTCRDCTAIAWVDADIEFLSPRIVESTVLRILQKHPMCQVWNVALDSGPEPGSVLKTQYASTSHIRARDRVLESENQCGYGWAATTAFLGETGGLLETCIIGGGDRVMMQACEGKVATPALDLSYSAGYRRCIREWTVKAVAACRGVVGSCPLLIRHGFHGFKSNRGYTRRYEVLKSHGFDPHLDITKNEDGVWEWSVSASPELREDVVGYFRSRQEDVVERSFSTHVSV